MSSFYWSEQQMQQDGVFPTVLAIGDSWFWYPFFGGSLVNYLGPIVAKKGNTILAKGNNGAEAREYVDGKYASIVKTSLKLYGDGLNAVFISGGGNDFAGFNDMRPLLQPDCAGAADAPACFKPGDSGLDGFLERTEDAYRRLVGLIYTYTRLDCVIVMHSYDYAIPNGQGLGHGKGWLGPALDDARVPTALRQACVRHLIDAFHAMLVRITAMDPGHLLVVDSRGQLGAGEWANELHPTRGGFKKIATNAWKPVLRQAGLGA
ncbi:SGNH/GDSL hydrolase family protein [Pseudorhodoferax sp. LjRoot39]|uniref:SGNH/GDSL hydrolase family protein n=1 Tax=Pseudorhodoferax sp. LjRoot39 TaxID=3342328 RepID=UPI003ED11A10